ncbi:MAG TPA: histone deacetylase family protein [Actinomycetota bacterium]|jgi:acetoin utilization deacetylase AcuC-like enzyme|nr:histone deacetylase family protein [Actinomycetota bacterium]
MDPMPVVAGEAHRGHDPPHEVNYGEVVRPPYERPERADRLRDALAAAGHPLVAPVPHGPGPVLAVHEPALVGFLEGAWPAWRAAGGPEVLIPDTFAIGRLARGGGRDPAGGTGRPGWFCFDTATPLVAGSFAAALAAADAALTAADLVAGGEPAAYALCRPPGHHAGPGYYGGFCLLNNAAIAARRLAALGRVAVVDVDFHHGNGTQDIFWEDAQVLYVSLHGDPAGHYPFFTGAADETGGGPGAGTTRNLPLPDGTGDDAYLAALDEAMAAVAAFDPAVLVVSAGFDTFEDDPIGAFGVTTGGFARIGAALAAAGRPLVVVQEGGYAVEALGANAVALMRGMS